jgi:P2-related tail formation protein
LLEENCGDVPDELLPWLALHDSLQVMSFLLACWQAGWLAACLLA